MKRILNYFLSSLKRFRRSSVNNFSETISTQTLNLPSEISNAEKIARFVFSPINVNPNTGKLKSNCYKPPAGYDEVSVNRLDFTNANFLKSIALKMQNTNRNYFGFGVITALDIRNSDSDIIYTPKKESTDYNTYHSDIKIGYTVIPGEELPAEISNKIQKLVKSTRLYRDNNPELTNWTGDEPL
jgi:hypothetical protein